MKVVAFLSLFRSFNKLCISESDKFTTHVVGTLTRVQKSSKLYYVQVQITVPDTLLSVRTDVVYWSLTVEMKLKKILIRR